MIPYLAVAVVAMVLPCPVWGVRRVLQTWRCYHRSDTASEHIVDNFLSTATDCYFEHKDQVMSCVEERTERSELLVIMPLILAIKSWQAYYNDSLEAAWEKEKRRMATTLALPFSRATSSCERAPSACQSTPRPTWRLSCPTSGSGKECASSSRSGRGRISGWTGTRTTLRRPGRS